MKVLPIAGLFLLFTGIGWADELETSVATLKEYEAVSDPENALLQGIRDKFVPAWNDACNRIGRNTLPKNSLWGFLKETYLTDYPDLVFCSPTKVNFFDF